MSESNQPSTPNPAQVPPPNRTSVGKVLAWVFGGCLAVVLLAIFGVFALITSYNSQLGASEPLSAEDQARLPIAQSYNADFEAQKANLPDFKNWYAASFYRGLPCASAVDQCILGDTGSTLDLDEYAGPSELKISDASKICDRVLAVGKTLGATKDSINDGTGYHPLAESANSRCVSMMEANGRSGGVGVWRTPSYFILGETSKGAPFAIQLTMTRQLAGTGGLSRAKEYIGYELMTSSVFDSPQPQEEPGLWADLSTGTAQAGAFLDTLANARRANYDFMAKKNPSPFDPETASWAKANFEKYFDVSADFKYFLGKDGLVRWFHVKSKDGFDACVSTGVEEELNIKDEDSGNSQLESGITGLRDVGKLISGPDNPHSIGDYYLGVCHN
jgi:hypothetical protein